MRVLGQQAPLSCILKGSAGAAPCSLPPLNDSDDIVHLDVQLVWFLKVLKGPHVSGLSLRAEIGHCPPLE